MAERVVLVVDNDGESAALLAEIVSEKECAMVSVPDGDSALAKLEESLPDALIISADAPKGLKTCQIVKEKPSFSSIPLVLFSDPDAAELDLATLPDGAQPDHHLLRPIEADILRATLALCLLSNDGPPAPPPIPADAMESSMENRVGDITENMEILERNHRLLVDENSRLFRQRQQALTALRNHEEFDEEEGATSTAEAMQQALDDADNLAEKLRSAEELLTHQPTTSQKDLEALEKAKGTAEKAGKEAKESAKQLQELEKELKALKKSEAKLAKDLEARNSQLKDAHAATADLVKKLATMEQADEKPKKEAERLRKDLKQAMALIQKCAIDLAQGRQQLDQANAQDEYRQEAIKKIGKTWQELSAIAKGIGKETGMRTYSTHLEDVLTSLKENLRAIRTLLQQSSKSRASQEKLVDKMYKTLTADWKK